MRLADAALDSPSGEDFRAASVRAAFATDQVQTWADQVVSLPGFAAVAVGLSEVNGPLQVRVEAAAAWARGVVPGSGGRRGRNRSAVQREQILCEPDDRRAATLTIEVTFADDGAEDALIDLVFQGLVAMVERSLATDAYRRQSVQYLAARDEANASSRAFDAAFEESVVGMALVPLRTEEAGRLRRMNDPLRRLTGLSDDQLQATNFVDLLQPEYRRIPESAYRRVLAGRRAPFKADGLLWREDGSSIWVRITGSPLLDDMGDPTDLLVQVEELSQRRSPELERAEELDAVTGLLKAQAFEAAVAVASDRAHRSGDPAAVFMTRIDAWDEIVDRYGAAAAEQVQCQVADRLRATLRLDDVMASLRDGEFAFLAQELTPGDAANVGARVGSALSAPYRVDGQDLALDVVLGAALTGELVGPTGSLTQRARDASELARQLPTPAGSSFRLRIDAEPESTTARHPGIRIDAPQVYRHRRR